MSGMRLMADAQNKPSRGWVNVPRRCSHSIDHLLDGVWLYGFMPKEQTVGPASFPWIPALNMMGPKIDEYTVRLSR